MQIGSTVVRAHQHAAATDRKGGQYRPDEPDDHAPGRSRGGLTTKIHLACDGKGRPFAILVTPGQRHDSICARPLLERIHVPAPARAGRAAGPIKSSQTRHSMLLSAKQLPRLPHRSAKTWHRADHPGEDRPTTAPAEPRLPRRETTEVRPGDPPATQYDRSVCSSLRSCPCIVRLLPARGWGRIRSDRHGRKVCRQPCVERERGAHRSHIVQNSITLRVSPTAGLRRLGPPAQGCDVQPDSGAISASAARMTHVAGAACDTERCGIAKSRESVWR
ncbi:transposase [Streptomyces sp. OK228]|uniref:transposase n=1 Tax=Streptomyces sp. OK228 TaxID=1882786 RepID=UPI0015CF77FA